MAASGKYIVMCCSSSCVLPANISNTNSEMYSYRALHPQAKRLIHHIHMTHHLMISWNWTETLKTSKI
jgi:hypothetical protein